MAKFDAKILLFRRDTGAEGDFDLFFGRPIKIFVDLFKIFWEHFFTKISVNLSLGRSSRKLAFRSRAPTGVPSVPRGGHVLISSLNTPLARMAIGTPFPKMRRTLFYHMG